MEGNEITSDGHKESIRTLANEKYVLIFKIQLTKLDIVKG